MRVLLSQHWVQHTGKLEGEFCPAGFVQAGGSPFLKAGSRDVALSVCLQSPGAARPGARLASSFQAFPLLPGAGARD